MNARFGELLRKMWNPTAFKGQVSPHELFQAISVESNRRYKSDMHSDPAEFLVWFLNSLHRGLGGTTANGSSIIHQVFQGGVRIESQRLKVKKGAESDKEEWEVEEKPFLHLTLDLPSTPLYADSLEKNIIPQVPLLNILHKFNGVTEHHTRGRLSRYQLLKLPRYIIFHIKRFSKNTQFQMEKNPTIVSFPIKKLDLRDFVELSEECKDQVVPPPPVSSLPTRLCTLLDGSGAVGRAKAPGDRVRWADTLAFAKRASPLTLHP